MKNLTLHFADDIHDDESLRAGLQLHQRGHIRQVHLPVHTRALVACLRIKEIQFHKLNTKI